jgi:hypothetical protein
MVKAMAKARDLPNELGNEELKDNIIINVLMKSVVFYQHKLPRGHRMEMMLKELQIDLSPDQNHMKVCLQLNQVLNQQMILEKADIIKTLSGNTNIESTFYAAGSKDPNKLMMLKK